MFYSPLFISVDWMEHYSFANWSNSLHVFGYSDIIIVIEALKQDKEFFYLGKYIFKYRISWSKCQYNTELIVLKVGILASGFREINIKWKIKCTLHNESKLKKNYFKLFFRFFSHYHDYLQIWSIWWQWILLRRKLAKIIICVW